MRKQEEKDSGIRRSRRIAALRYKTHYLKDEEKITIRNMGQRRRTLIGRELPDNTVAPDNGAEQSAKGELMTGEPSHATGTEAEGEKLHANLLRDNQRGC